MKVWVLFLWTLASTAFAADLTSHCADRAAIERVYHNHRTGEKPPFEQALPSATLEDLVLLDLKKESVLRRHYGMAITPALLEGEVERINRTTRAPETLAEIKAALGNDPKRFAESFAKPFLVERLLRDKFENDDALHATARRECEQLRTALLTAKTNGATTTQLITQLKQANSNTVTETAWQLTARPVEPAPPSDEMEIKKRFGADAQILSAPRGPGREQNFYLEDLPRDLQNVLRAQLRAPGDISAVIETSTGFLLYVAKEKSATVLDVAGLALPKRGYEAWLNEQQLDDP